MFSLCLKKLHICISFCALLSLVSFAEASEVKIENNSGRFTLTVDGEPFFIKGVGGTGDKALLAEFGGNAFRTWGHDDAEEQLALAKEHNLMVSIGFWVQHERHGFDYNDEEAVQKQFELAKQMVLDYKDHPNLLMWGIGNEVELEYTNPKVWKAIGDIASMIKELDPNHPVMTTTAHIKQEECDLINEFAPDIDILGINSYAGATVVAKQVQDYGWDKPYVFTEWGVNGHWERPKTDWDANIEQTSTEKAEAFDMRYEKAIAVNDGQCLGGFAFLWGTKQERTGTWYSLFDSEGNYTEAVNVLRHHWKGIREWNRAPKIEVAVLNNKVGTDNIRVSPGSRMKAKVFAEDPDFDKLQYSWELLNESEAKSHGGDYEARPDEVKTELRGSDSKTLRFRAPEAGAYRLFIFIYDGNRHVSTANIPFLVE